MELHEAECASLCKESEGYDTEHVTISCVFLKARIQLELSRRLQKLILLWRRL
jgi:hypothetical protein